MRDELTSTARTLRVLELLRARPGISAAQLAERLGVTDRAARRHVHTLRRAGICVESTRGRHGGYRLGPGVRLPPLSFTTAEALALVMAVLDGHHAAADPDDPVGSALGAIIRALPDAVGAPAALMREHARAAPDRRARPDPAITTSLIDAAVNRTRVELTYRTGSGRAWRTRVDPWAVVVRHGRWYLLCHAHDVDDVRTLRVDRVDGIEPTAERFTPPSTLDPVPLLEQRLGSGWAHETRVVLDAPLAEVAPHVRAVMGRLEALDDNRCLLVGTTNNPRMYAGEWLANLPFAMHVEGGPELRRAVGQIADALAASLHPTPAAPRPGSA